MAHHRLGHADEARALLVRLRDTMKRAPWRDDAESRDFLREAETLIDPPSRPGGAEGHTGSIPAPGPG
jgi:hypothetical protein